MAQNFPCPKCGTNVSAPAGAPMVQCGKCDHMFAAAAPTKIDPFDDYTGKATSEGAAEDLLRAWQVEMPPVKSVYAPSGELPSSAISMLSAGVLAAFAAAVLAELIAGAVSLIVVAILVFCNGIIAVVGFIFWPLLILLLIVLLIAAAAPFGVGGWVASRVTGYFGKLGKNRNPLAAIGAATAAAFLSAVVVMAILFFVGKPWLLSIEDWELTPRGVNIGLGILFVVGIFTAIGFAAYDAWSEMGRQRFCEDCEQHMQKQTVATLTPPTLKRVVHAIRAKDLQEVIRLVANAKGKRGEVSLHQCPGCSTGCLEIMVHFKVRWFVRTRSRKDNGERTKEESWLAISVPLKPKAVEAVRQVATA